MTPFLNSAHAGGSGRQNIMRKHFVGLKLKKASNMHRGSHLPSTRQCIPCRGLLQDPGRGFQQRSLLRGRICQAARRPGECPEGAAAAPLTERPAAPRRLAPNIVPWPRRVLTLPACRLMLRPILTPLTCHIIMLSLHSRQLFICFSAS